MPTASPALTGARLRLKPPYAKAEVAASAMGATVFDATSGLPIRLEVPTDATAEGRVVRLHEAYHAVLGASGFGLGRPHHPLSVQLLEDCLIHGRIFPQLRQGLVRSDIVQVAKDELAMARIALKNKGAPKPIRDIASLMAVRAAVTLKGMRAQRSVSLPEPLKLAVQTAEHNMLVLLLRSFGGQWAFNKDHSTYRYREKILTAFDAIFGFEPPPPPPLGTGKPLSELMERTKLFAEEGDVKVDWDKLDAMHPMDIEECLPRSMPTALAKRRLKYRARSGRKMDPKRLPKAMVTRSTDGLFIRRRKAEGACGTVLIDASGSMGITHDLMTEMVTVAPGATIAIYAGMGDDPNSLGTLFVLARDGKLCVDMPYHGAGNSVDYWALKWLLEQEGPLTYVGDLGFCGGPPGQRKASEILFDRMKAHGVVTHFFSAREAVAHWQKQFRVHR